MHTLEVENEGLLCRHSIYSHCQLACEFTAVRFAEHVERDGAEVGMGVEELTKEVDEIDRRFCVCGCEKRIIVHV